MDITQLLAFSVKNNASDLHLSAGQSPIIRVDGDMRRVNLPILDHKQVHSMVYDIMNDKQRKAYEEKWETDFSFEIPGVARFRVNAFNQNRGAAAVFRTIPSKILSLEDLNAPSIFKKIADKPRGLVLVTGPTGSGKSTTLAAMVDYKNKTEYGHILTIEDPIEFVHESKKCLINQREVHRDTQGFDEALRSALREDPDTILVGEMRDLETIRLALSAAETGHLVFGTLHTTSAPKTIDRIVDVFPAAEKDMVRSMISSSLEAIIAQTLMKKVGGGRVAAHEIMLGTDAIRNMIKENKLAQMRSTLQTSAGDGMQTMDQSLQKLIAQGLVSREVALKKAANPAAL
ncbi:MAG TPA: type IV pilus twitching motility protein PilT [Leucothrix mucor]|uniref:Type IV pilus twitching motility protein PilT n=1 Tax=Leucothrix mucor TaxID=45248 RepID=A0A7V2WUT0_LEUMU|nr:type IV pilus twitching motility protein PilT [Leucothrix mucor]